MVIVGLRDRVADRFLNVQLERNDKTACRGFIGAFRNLDGQSLLLTNPEDYDLVRIGEFNTITGEVKNDYCVLMSGIQAFNYGKDDEDADA